MLPANNGNVIGPSKFPILFDNPSQPTPSEVIIEPKSTHLSISALLSGSEGVSFGPPEQYFKGQFYN